MIDNLKAGDEARKMLGMFEICAKALMTSVSLIREYAKVNGYEGCQIERFLDRLWLFAKENADGNESDCC